MEALGFALAVDPNSAETHLVLGNAHAARNDIDAAIVEYREAVRLAPDMPAAKRKLTGAEAQRARTP